MKGLQKGVFQETRLSMRISCEKWWHSCLFRLIILLGVVQEQTGQVQEAIATC